MRLGSETEVRWREGLRIEMIGHGLEESKLNWKGDKGPFLPWSCELREFREQPSMLYGK